MVRTASLICFMLLQSASLFAASPANENAKLYFISPANGAVVSNPVTIQFGLKNMGVAPAGSNVNNTGHHHLIIDSELPPLNLPVPKDEQHRHFGAGQTETSIELSPGIHTLQLLLGDFAHIPHSPAVVSEQITITVK